MKRSTKNVCGSRESTIDMHSWYLMTFHEETSIFPVMIAKEETLVLELVYVQKEEMFGTWIDKFGKSKVGLLLLNWAALIGPFWC